MNHHTSYRFVSVSPLEGINICVNTRDLDIARLKCYMTSVSKYRKEVTMKCENMHVFFLVKLREGSRGVAEASDCTRQVVG